VFWSGDPVRAAVLKLKQIAMPYHSPGAQSLPAMYSDPDGFWTGFSARVRVVIYNTKLIPRDRAPVSIFDLANDPLLKGKGCIANPLFGTTSMHAAALFIALGDEKARGYFEALSRNGVKVLSSNGEVRRRVAAADCAIGIADSDDAYEAIKDNKPVAVVYPDESGIGTLIVPNAAVLIANSPNPAGGKKFIDYLLSPGTEQALAESDAAQIPLLPNVPTPPHVRTLATLHPMTVDFGKLAAKLEELSRGFLRECTARSMR
jgi:iron(III) transport system substrate-binding protein